MKLQTAAILAGGKSRRFGNDKALAPFGETSLIEHIFSSLKLFFDEIFIISGESRKYGFSGAKVLPDLFKSAGPLGGIHTALSAAEENYVFIAACDMPYISGELIIRMRSEILKSLPPAVVAERDGFIEPFHAFYSAELIPKIEKTIKGPSCGIFAFLKETAPVVLKAENERTFANINTPDDLEKYSRTPGPENK